MSTIAQAQAYQCRAPQGPISVPRIIQDEPTRATQVTGYTLSLSWSPEYCRNRERNPDDRIQCSGANGRFGLVLHGLWPEGEDGNWPQWCPTQRRVSPALLRENICMTPSAELLARQWTKHGACMIRSPESYFNISRLLWDSLEFPDLDALSRTRSLNAGMVREAFVEANRSFERDEIGLKLSRNGWLQEIRLCYASDFRPGACMPSQFGPENSVEVKIWRGL
jgi:ribonuclease T2